MNPRVVVVSDLHLAPSGPLASFRAGDALASFVRAHATLDTTIVLAGDIIDFLQLTSRPPVLDFPRAPELIERTLAAIKGETWGQALFDAFAALLRAGGRCVLLPGNHDPELHHPDVPRLFLRAFGLDAHHERFIHHTDDSPWTTQLGDLEVLVGHGHRGDLWNDIDPAAVRRALETGDQSSTPPPGSRLVLEVMNDFKLACDAKTGQPRFPFVDLLKPEIPAVPLLLLYLDRALAAQKLLPALGLQMAALVRPLMRALSRGRVLGPEPETRAAPPDAPDNIEALLAASIAGALSDADRAAPEATLRTFALWVEGKDGAPVPGTLAAHGGVRRWLVRAAIRELSHDGTFFDQTATSPVDRAIMRAHLPESGDRRRVAVFGHTHAARQIHEDARRTYINTGTWMDLMRLPNLARDDEVAAWIDALEAGHVERERRLTYAEVTALGASLRPWPGEQGE